MPFKARTKLQGTFVDDCRTLTDSELVEKWVYREVPYAFRGSPAAFQNWLKALAQCLELDAAAICVVGSTAAGLSLSPFKTLRPHSADSDIDLGIVAPVIFREAWDWFVHQRIERIALPSTVNNWIDDHKTRLIFYRQIGCEQYLEYLPFGRKWIGCLGDASKRAPAVGRNVKARIYQDKEALTNYLRHGISDVRRNLGL